MSASPFTQIDLSKLPPPEALIELSFDDILEEMSVKFKADNPELSESLNFESEPITALNQAWAYREQQLRSYWNTLFKQTFLAFATGASLDQHAAMVPLTRLEGEKDNEFRNRIQAAPEAYSTAGPIGAYAFHAKAVSTDIIDVFVPDVREETAGEVSVYVLMKDGADESAILTSVTYALSDDIRPLTDFVSVLPALRDDYEIIAELTIGEGPDSSVVLAAAIAAAEIYAESRLSFGKPIYHAALAAAHVVPGVENVNLIEPQEDIIPAANAVARLTSIAVTEANNV